VSANFRRWGCAVRRRWRASFFSCSPSIF